uniref:Uncharacterized protein n=1 Tax=Romanomermis culicivorax TaxID=13658 RepID=A0A915JWB4_ROMCU
LDEITVEILQCFFKIKTSSHIRLCLVKFLPLHRLSSSDGKPNYFLHFYKVKFVGQSKPTFLIIGASSILKYTLALVFLCFQISETAHASTRTGKSVGNSLATCRKIKNENRGCDTVG